MESIQVYWFPMVHFWSSIFMYHFIFLTNVDSNINTWLCSLMFQGLVTMFIVISELQWFNSQLQVMLFLIFFYITSVKWFHFQLCCLPPCILSSQLFPNNSQLHVMFLFFLYYLCQVISISIMFLTTMRFLFSIIAEQLSTAYNVFIYFLHYFYQVNRKGDFNFQIVHFIMLISSTYLCIAKSNIPSKY